MVVPQMEANTAEFDCSGWAIRVHEAALTHIFYCANKICQL